MTYYKLFLTKDNRPGEPVRVNLLSCKFLPPPPASQKHRFATLVWVSYAS